MSSAPRITEVRFSAGNRHDRSQGLLGWVSFLIDGWLRIDGATLRRSRSGKLYIGYPAPTDSHGTQRYLLRPICDHARLQVQRQVLEAIAAEVRS